MSDPKKVNLWTESEAEARDFIELINKDADFEIDNIFIAKRSRGIRDVGHAYIEGKYYPFNINLNAMSGQPVTAPNFVTDLVQWCSPDVIIADDSEAILSLETTYHKLTYDNVAQRIPRVVRGSSLGVPSIIFQKVDYSFRTEITWFVKTFLNASKIYGTPCLAILFDDQQFNDARENLVSFVNKASIDKVNMMQFASMLLGIMEEIAEDYSERTLLFQRNGRRRKWLEMDIHKVVVYIGVRDNCALTGIPGYGCQGDDYSKAEFRKQLKLRSLGEKGCVWLSKGTGGMDPYPGLVKMAELLLCYDETGNKVKRLISFFSCLPRDFWWFQKFPNEIYYKLINEFSDEVRYAEGYR